ncbi:hypothetical protein A6B34_09355 [Mycolicibacterium monacense]|nr:hypothetical protein A6B34_09355 [Mycolicibacterium monacense]
MDADWSDGGNTNVDELGLACGADNRSVDKDGGWSTRMNDQCEVEWIPPPRLDTGQARLNHYHRPERLLRPSDDPVPTSQDRSGAIEPADGGKVGDAESGPPRSADDTGEPGGPAPPGNRAA